jgi:hypothetical protein
LSAASTFSRKGSLPPKRRATRSPSSRLGLAAMAAVSVPATPSRVSTDGALGCAPIHSSACGPALGVGSPSSSAIAVRDPQA